MKYDTNGIDLLTIRNTTPKHKVDTGANYDDLLLTLTNYNTQHEPQQVIQTNGQVTTLSYNAAGQLNTSKDPLGHVWSYLSHLQN